jgi:hypothetical protein
MRTCVLLAVVVLTACDAENSSPCDADELVLGDPVPLFDGVSLAGWIGDSEVWSVDAAAGEIVGDTAIERDYNTFLIADGRMYGDFRLTVEAKLVGGEGNSGIQYRSIIVNPDRFVVAGYQADITAGRWGTIYEEIFDRSVLVRASAECQDGVREDDWNTYEIEAYGCRIRHAINGVVCGEFGEGAANRPPLGFVALQYHAPGGFEVRFRNLQIAEAIP